MDFERRESLDDIQKLFMHCLKAFTQQNVDTLIYEPNLFLWDKNSLDEIMVNDSHKVFRKTQLVFMVCIITREFCRLYNSGERQQNSIIEKLVHSVDLHVIKELNTVLVPGITKNSISSVAYESYESEQTNKAAIAFVPENVDINEALRDDFISIKDIDYITICQDNIHGTRKLLNLSENGTIVYKGVKLPAPKDWKVGKRFYFPEFVSTSLNFEIAKNFAKRNDNTYGPILVIKIKNNGINGRMYYCRSVEEITQFHGENEVLITAFCIFQITRIDGNTYYLDCEGY